MDFRTPTKKDETLRPQPTESKDDHKSRKKYFGHLFVFIIFCVIIFQYYVYVFEVYLKKILSNYTPNLDCPYDQINFPITILLIFHILLVFLLWSLGVTMNTHPGEIPLYWVSNILIKGFLHRWRRLQTQALLPNMQRVQAGAFASLQCLQFMRT
jgi:hypothetical protein